MSWSTDDVNEAFNTALSAWNLYGLPLLLAAVAVGSWRARKADPARDDRRLAVRRLGLAHYALALWGLTTIVAEVWEAHASGQGIFPSNPVTGLYGSAVAVAVDVPVGFGLRRLWRVARWAALVPAAVRLAFGAWATSWIWRFGAPFEPSEWPLYATRVLPAFALALLLWPGTGRVFRGETPAGPGRLDAAFALVARLFLVVLGSVVVTDAADHTVRAVAEAMGGPGV
jgi:hypothetical protein